VWKKGARSLTKSTGAGSAKFARTWPCEEDAVHDIPQLVTTIVWCAFFLSWIGGAFWADRAQKRPASRDSWLYRAVTTAGIALLVAGGVEFSYPANRLWSFAPVVGYALAAVVLAGLAFTWWGRLYLGRMWSSSVTRKADHHVVDSGPYAIVRHPIYTGIILGCLATAVELGTALALAGALVIWVGFWIKARLEERFLGVQLGEGAYDAYRRKVPMLIPFWPARGLRAAGSPSGEGR
jgi:protein-S-isoprenylcysteine O-methyltransferase Ste14